MLHILGGVSRTGKSMIADRLLKEEQLAFFSTDFLMMGFEKGYPDFGVSSNNPSFDVAEKIWPILKGMMTTLIEVKQSYLIEGDALLPRHISKLIHEVDENQIRACFAGYANADPNQKVLDIRRFKGANDWMKDRDDEFVLEFVEKQIEYSKKIKEECLQYSIQYFDTSENFGETTNRVVNFMKA